MMIVCPNCATSYQVDGSPLGGAGRSVRCVRCRNIWFVHDAGALSAIAQAHRSDVEALAGPFHDSAPDEHVLPDHPSDEAPAELVIESEPAPSESWSDAAEDPSGLRHELSDEDDPLPHEQEPVAIADAPALAPMEEDAALPADAALEGTLAEDAKPFIARRAPQREGKPFRWPLPGLPVVILTLV